MGVGAGVCVDVGVDMRVGMGVGADVGGGLGVAVDMGMDVAVAAAVGDGAITIGGADVDVDLGAAVGLGADMAAVAVATAVGDGATAILGGITDAVGDGVGSAAGGLGAAQPAVIANTIAAIARAGGSAALITAALRQLHEGCAVAAALARFRLERARKRMAVQMLAHRVSQHALALAVNDAHRTEAVAHRLVQELL